MNLDYEKLYKQSISNIEAFWENIAHELRWFKPWKKVLDWKYPYARWFVDGETNIVHNALDRHLKTSVNMSTFVRPSKSGIGKKDKLALIWVGQDLTEKTFTYQQLNDQVCRFANGLKTLGVKKGDRVTIYLPRIPEQFIAMLACVKIGAIHSVVYSGFSAEALKNRIDDAQAKVIITTNSYPYGEKTIDSLKNVHAALKENQTVKYVIIVNRINQKNSTNISSYQKSNRSYKSDTSDLSGLPNSPDDSRIPRKYSEILWDDLLSKQDTLCSTEIMNSTDPAFILYTSGTTGKPKGILHSHGGYMVGVYYTFKTVFDIQEDDIFWSTADAGWITGHSYILYGPLLNGITTFIYEGPPHYPDIEIWWRLIEKYKITKFYTAPTAIRMLMRYGDDKPKKYDLSSLKILGSVGEPINPEAWKWFYKNIGREKLPIMDTWWQTETGMHILTPIPRVRLKPGSCFKPFFGIEADVVDIKDNKLITEKSLPRQGHLVIKTPWPAMMLDVFNNPTRYQETYFKENQFANKISEKQQYKNFLYFTGDMAKIDENGYFWILGRDDDVIKVSGHRLGSAEIESALVANKKVAEAAVIGKPHEVKGESIKAFVILKHEIKPSEELKKELTLQVRMQIGPIATPDEIKFVEKLPKTRSGKIMRRVLKAQELGLPIGDVSTLED